MACTQTYAWRQAGLIPTPAAITVSGRRIVWSDLPIDYNDIGYSSVSYVRRFKVDTPKIDKSFADDSPDDENDCGAPHG